jgi:hypothetical protein
MLAHFALKALQPSFQKIVFGFSVLAVAVGCSQDPAFSEKSSFGAQPVRQNPGVENSKGSSDASESDVARRGGQEGPGQRTEVDPGSGEELATAPGSLPGEGNPGGNSSGSGAEDSVTGSTSGEGNIGTGDTDSSGGRTGTNENPSTGGGVAETQPTPGPMPTAVPTTKPMPRPGAEVLHEVAQKQGKADILWVVDDSLSMSFAQNQLTSKFETFAQRLQQARVDFRVAVTSMDVCDINWETGAAKPNSHCPDAKDITPGQWVNGEMVGPAQGRFTVDKRTGKSVLTAGPDFVETFGRLAKLGTSGSSLEHGLTAARMAVDKAISGINKGFVRSDAYLSVIVLSDEEDDGVQMWCEDAWGRTSLNADGKKDLSKCKEGGVSPFLDAFRRPPYALMQNAAGKPVTTYKFTADMWKAYMEKPNVKGPGKFRLSAITGMRGSNGKIFCDLPDASPGSRTNSKPLEAGTNYIKAAQLTGGVVENICAPEWDTILSNIGVNIGELANKIPLPTGKIPFPGSLQVWVDGVKLEATKFTYETEGNFLSFKQTPASGAKIRVKYLETLMP